MHSVIWSWGRCGDELLLCLWFLGWIELIELACKLSTYGIERRSAYQREILVDPMKMQAYVSHSSAGSPTNLSEWERMQIEDALSRLSAQERVCYVMKHGEGYSFKYIADQMGLSPSTVENYVLRAQKKVSEQFNCRLVIEVVVG
jgi:DNA-directed RNA polymerase specialized sigma24 family protein